MDQENKTDSGFKLDVSADKAALSSALPEPEVLPSKIIHTLSDIEKPNSINYTDIIHPNIELPESTVFKSTLPEIQPTSLTHKSFLNESPLVKVKPEDVLKKAKEIEDSLNALKKDTYQMHEQSRYPDPRMNQRDNFDERPTIPAQNDIFTNRKNRMSQFPDWR